MGDIVSLKQQRKRRDREVRDETASKNRVKFGGSKKERQLAKALRDKTAKDLDGHKR